jgi:hypothetical protein
MLPNIQCEAVHPTTKCASILAHLDILKANKKLTNPFKSEEKKNRSKSSMSPQLKMLEIR